MPARVDEVDIRILQMLRGDARLSARAIGRGIGMSPGAVSERIARLERDGVLLGYSADIDAARLGVGMLAIIGIQAAHDSKLADMVEQILKIPECDNVYVITGGWDLLVFLRVRDQHHLSEVLFSNLWRAQGFRHSETMIVLDRERAPRRHIVGYPRGKAVEPPTRAAPIGRKAPGRKAARP